MSLLTNDQTNRDYAIEAIEEFAMTAKQDAEIAELINRIFNADLGGRSFAQNRHHRRYVIYCEDRLAAHLAICFRAVRLGDECVNVIGIGEVVVDKPYRRQGMASALVARALKDGAQSLADFAMLFGTEKIYAKTGFGNVPNILTVTEMDGAQTKKIERKSHGAFMVKSLGSKIWNNDAPVDLAGFSF